jgi:hypothetical protein
VKGQAVERENWNCDKGMDEKVRRLQEDLQHELRKIDELKAKNGELEAKLLLAVGRKWDTLSAKQNITKCMVVGDSVLRSFGAEHSYMMVECFAGIKTEPLHRVIE